MSRKAPGPIKVPKGLLAGRSAEVARIWITNNAGSTVLIDAEVLADPKVFGILMADTIRHAAKAYAQAWSLDEEAALQAIVVGLAEELRDQFNTVTPIERSN
jgi:Domain of unknown function (DUF5076)